MLFNWRRRMLDGGFEAFRADDPVVGANFVWEFERRCRELERLLGKKMLELDILEESFEAARPKKPISLLRSWSGWGDGSR